MKYVLPDIEGTTLMEVSIDMKTHDGVDKDGEEHIVKIMADKEQWLTLDQAEDLARALAMAVKQGERELKKAAIEKAIKQFENIIEERTGEKKPARGGGGILQ
jgi:hypothetical protein